jgi:CheY-like chemotaxis protein
MTEVSGRKVLVVDDEPDMLLYLSALLEDNDYEPCTAADGEEAWEVIQAERPDLIILDLRMPRKTGLQLYRLMLADEAFAKLPVVFITGMTDFRFYGEDCAPLPEPVARLGKPIDHEELLGVLRRTLGA